MYVMWEFGQYRNLWTQKDCTMLQESTRSVALVNIPIMLACAHIAYCSPLTKRAQSLMVPQCRIPISSAQSILTYDDIRSLPFNLGLEIPDTKFRIHGRNFDHAWSPDRPSSFVFTRKRDCKLDQIFEALELMRSLARLVAEIASPNLDIFLPIPLLRMFLNPEYFRLFLWVSESSSGVKKPFSSSIGQRSAFCFVGDILCIPTSFTKSSLFRFNDGILFGSVPETLVVGTICLESGKWGGDMSVVSDLTARRRIFLRPCLLRVSSSSADIRSTGLIIRHSRIRSRNSFEYGMWCCLPAISSTSHALPSVHPPVSNLRVRLHVILKTG